MNALGVVVEKKTVDRLTNWLLDVKGGREEEFAGLEKQIVEFCEEWQHVSCADVLP